MTAGSVRSTYSFVFTIQSTSRVVEGIIFSAFLQSDVLRGEESVMDQRPKRIERANPFHHHAKLDWAVGVRAYVHTRYEIDRAFVMMTSTSQY